MISITTLKTQCWKQELQDLPSWSRRPPGLSFLTHLSLPTHSFREKPSKGSLTLSPKTRTERILLPRKPIGKNKQKPQDFAEKMLLPRHLQLMSCFSSPENYFGGRWKHLGINWIFRMIGSVALWGVSWYFKLPIDFKTEKSNTQELE